MATLVGMVNAAALAFFLLLASHATAAEVRLGWDPPADAGDGPVFGKVAGYKFYYGPYHGQGYDNIAGVVDVGHDAIYTMTGLTPGETYFFAVTAYDSSGNETEFSNIVVTTIANTPAGTADASPADAGSPPSAEAYAASTAVGSGAVTGETGVPESWNGWHHEQPGEGVSQPYDPEDASSVTWTNYRLSLTLGSEHHDDIGVIFRYHNRTNFYRFLWSDQHNSRRLEKLEGGEFVLLAEETVSAAPMQPYDLAVVADGEVLKVWIDDTLIFAVNDDSFLSGGIALYASGTGENSFDNILVEDLDSDQVLLWDDFSTGMFADWMIVDESTSADLPEWSAASGVLVHRADFDPNVVDPSDLAWQGTFALYKP